MLEEVGITKARVEGVKKKRTEGSKERRCREKNEVSSWNNLFLLQATFPSSQTLMQSLVLQKEGKVGQVVINEQVVMVVKVGKVG